MGPDRLEAGDTKEQRGEEQPHVHSDRDRRGVLRAGGGAARQHQRAAARAHVHRRHVGRDVVPRAAG